MASLTVVKAAESNSAVSDPAFSICCKGVTHKTVRWVATYQRSITDKFTQTTTKKSLFKFNLPQVDHWAGIVLF